MKPIHAISALALTIACLSPLSAGSTPLPAVSPDTMLFGTARYSAVAARGPRGGVAVRRGGTVAARGPGGGVAVARPGYRPGYRPVPVPVRSAWVRPVNYWWRPGAAVAAGAAIGFVTAAAATAYAAPAAPAPGYCWYYTNTQRTQGFWDTCPP
jgi:hypothetical protein